MYDYFILALITILYRLSFSGVCTFPLSSANFMITRGGSLQILPHALACFMPPFLPSNPGKGGCGCYWTAPLARRAQRHDFITLCGGKGKEGVKRAHGMGRERRRTAASRGVGEKGGGRERRSRGALWHHPPAKRIELWFIQARLRVQSCDSTCVRATCAIRGILNTTHR